LRSIKKSSEAASLTVTVDYLGGLGDGVANTGSGRLHIPFTAPGDEARVVASGKESGKLIELLNAGPDRISPACIHFGSCGGCSLQHLAPSFIAEWKRMRIAAALARAGLGHVVVDALIAVPPCARRRATLAAERFGNRVTLGFTERASHALVDLTECGVLRPELVAILPALRDSLRTLLNNGEAADIGLTLTETGIDLALIRSRPLTLPDREALASLAEHLDLARIAWRAGANKEAEPVAVRHTPSVRLGTHSVILPVGGFLQPSVEGQTHLTKLVLDGLAGCTGSVVDIFSGLGTFAFPASVAGPVVAFDSDGEAIAALQVAAKRDRAAVTGHRRDLFREPLTAKELGGFGAAIIDPPRAGASAQSKMLAASSIPVIAAVSCSPVSFARDAAILAEGGYMLEKVTPVDQFPWSPHVELMGVFRRA